MAKLLHVTEHCILQAETVSPIAESLVSTACAEVHTEGCGIQFVSLFCEHSK